MCDEPSGNDLMRKLLLAGFALCFAIVAAAGARAAIPAPSSIVGTWIGKDEAGQGGAFIFRADGSADIIKGGVSLKESVAGTAGTVTYRFDPSVTPIALDFVLEGKDRPKRTIHCIAEFTSADKMRVRMPSDDSRPKNFAGPTDDILEVHRAGSEK